MYIKYNGQKYVCERFHLTDDNTAKYYGLPSDFPSPVSGEIELFTDDGFFLRGDDAADYLRQIFSDGVLTFTNTPEPEPEPVPEPEPGPEEPTMAERVEELESENKILTAKVAALSDQNDFQEELIVELANIVYA